MLEAIEAADWNGLPAPADRYEPARAATGLRALATATGLVRAADTGSLLAGGGLVHDHSGTVFPSAVCAAALPPRHRTARAPGGRGDRSGAARRRPGVRHPWRYTRVATSYAEVVPVCCALADHLRGGAGLLAERGREGRRLLADAAEHRRFDVEEAFTEGDGVAAFGVLAGRFPAGTPAAELHRCGRVAALERVVLLHPPEDGGPPRA